MDLVVNSLCPKKQWQEEAGKKRRFRLEVVHNSVFISI